MTTLALLLVALGLLAVMPWTVVALIGCAAGPTVLHYRSERPAGYRMLPRAVAR